MNMERQRTTNARKRTVDITNKKNEYCSHCEHCDYSFVHNCLLHGKKTHYWQKCKDFAFDDRYVHPERHTVDWIMKHGHEG